jgi:AcrR family transcriptional regulator
MDLRPSAAGLPKKTKRRSRRSSEQIVDLLIEAACSEFERNGYERAKTAAIARRAGVTEALIFSNFGSKAKLFHDSIFKPLSQHFLKFCATHLVEADDAEGAKAWTREYTRELQKFIADHSLMLKTVIAAKMFASDSVPGLGQVEGLHDFFSKTTAKSVKRLSGKPRIHPKLMSRVSFATILACVVFKDWLFPEGLASEGEISAAISDFILEGLNANAGSQKIRGNSGRTHRLANGHTSAARRPIP